ncbi:unnamed protein product [Scytosiphon promiscuus]
MFAVELAGHGVVRDPGFPPYPVFVISVTQPIQRFSSFRSLGEHLGNTVLVAGGGGLPGCPHMTDEMLMGSDDQLDRARVLLQQWLHSTLLFPGCLRNFLCASANSPPPRLEIHWASSAGGHCPSLDDMQMDELFGRHPDDHEVRRHGGKGFPSKERTRPARVSTLPSKLSSSRLSTSRSTRPLLPCSCDVLVPILWSRPLSMDLESRSFSRGGQRGYEPAACDMPNEEPSRLACPSSIFFRAGGARGISGSLDSEQRLTEATESRRHPGLLMNTNQSHPKPLSGSTSSGDGTDSANDRQGAFGAGGGMGDAGTSTTGVAGGGGGGGPGCSGSSMGGGMPVALSQRKVGLDSFKIVRVIGKGSFGKVFLVREKVAGDIYAMKVLRKDNIIKRNQVEHTKTERNVLGYVKHPFIVGLNMAFQTRDKLFFVLDYCAGGELFFHLGKHGKFPEARSRFYSAEIALALQHVHQLDIVYRDLKPENVLLDGEGHIRLTDFGLSKEGISNTTSGAHSFCGTPEYLAPEILNRQGHGRAVDWWSLGALLYEMLTGLPPFYCRDRERLFEKIRKGNLTYPRYLSANAQDILHGLLTRDPSRRLGSSLDDAQEVQRHPFFAPLDWDLVMRREVAPPWEPTLVGSLDSSQFDREFTSMPIFSPDQRDYKLGQSAASNDDTFEGFTFVDSSSTHLLNATGGQQTAAPTGSSTASPHPGAGGGGGRGGRTATGGGAPSTAVAKAAAATAAAAPTPMGLHPQQRLMVDAMDTPDI